MHPEHKAQAPTACAGALSMDVEQIRQTLEQQCASAPVQINCVFMREGR